MNKSVRFTGLLALLAAGCGDVDAWGGGASDAAALPSFLQASVPDVSVKIVQTEGDGCSPASMETSPEAAPDGLSSFSISFQRYGLQTSSSTPVVEKRWCRISFSITPRPGIGVAAVHVTFNGRVQLEQGVSAEVRTSFGVRTAGRPSAKENVQTFTGPFALPPDNRTGGFISKHPAQIVQWPCGTSRTLEAYSWMELTKPAGHNSENSLITMEYQRLFGKERAMSVEVKLEPCA